MFNPFKTRRCCPKVPKLCFKSSTMLGFPSWCKFQASAEGRIISFLLNLSPSFLSLHLSIFTLLPYLCIKNFTMDPEFLRPSSRENYWWWWHPLSLFSKLKFVITLKGSKITMQNQEMVIALDPLCKMLKDKVKCNKSKKWNNNNESNLTEWYS